jgi:tetratricopeptide (TPR) repeat protein
MSLLAPLRAVPQGTSGRLTQDPHMPPRRTRVIPPLLLLAPALALAPILAFAQGGGSGPKKVDETAAAPSAKYAGICLQGNAKYASRDFDAAIALYRSAIESDPKNPLGHYLLGEAQLAAGNVAEADAAWNRASLESSEKDPTLRARILFVIADLKEREWKWDDAKAAWQVYLDWARSFPNAVVFPASAHSRQQVIDVMLMRDKACEVVRRRIAETKDGGVFTDLSKAPADAAK